MARRAPPVLRPSAAPARSPLPRAVPVLALIALALLGFYAVPAVAEHGRLVEEHAELERRAHEAQALLDQRRRELRAARRGTTSPRRAEKELLGAGSRYIESRSR